MASLSGKTIAATYRSVLNVGTANNQNLDATPRIIEDGVGTNSALWLATGAVHLGVDDTGADFRVFSATTGEGLFYDASEDELGLLLTTKLKFHDIGGGEEMYASGNGVLVLNSGTSLTITTPTLDLTCSTKVDFDSPILDTVTQGVTVELKQQVDALSFDGASDNILNIDAANNRVGIGCSTPGSPLEVRGPVGADFAGAGLLTLSTAEVDHITSGDVLGAIQFQAPVETSGTDAILPGAAIWGESEGSFTSSANHTALVFATANSETALAYAQERMRIDNEGKVGIGTSDPVRLLHINGSNAQILLEESATQFVRLGVEITSDDMCLGWDDSDDMHFGLFESTIDAHISTLMIITSAGNVGIGTESPTAQLHIDQASSSGAIPVLKLDQADVDDSFIDFIGTTASDQTKSLSTDTSVGALTGHIKIEINGSPFWLAYYAAN